VCNDDIHFT